MYTTEECSTASPHKYHTWLLIHTIPIHTHSSLSPRCMHPHTCALLHTSVFTVSFKVHFETDAISGSLSPSTILRHSSANSTKMGSCMASSMSAMGSILFTKFSIMARRCWLRNIPFRFSLLPENMSMHSGLGNKGQFVQLPTFRKNCIQNAKFRKFNAGWRRHRKN